MYVIEKNPDQGNPDQGKHRSLPESFFPPQLTVIVTSRLRSPRDRDEVAKSEPREASREKRATKSREHPKRNMKT